MLSCFELAAGQEGHCESFSVSSYSSISLCFPYKSHKCPCISLALWENKVEQYAGVIPSEKKRAAWAPWAKIQGRE